MYWYKQAIRNYFNFSGRARRTEYWMFLLCNAIITYILSIVDIFIGFEFFSGLYSLFILIPTFSIEFRRLHDIDKSAWWLLISLIPVIGGLVLFVFSVMPGTIGTNRYGDDPKDIYSI